MLNIKTDLVSVLSVVVFTKFKKLHYFSAILDGDKCVSKLTSQLTLLQSPITRTHKQLANNCQYPKRSSTNNTNSQSYTYFISIHQLWLQ